MGLSAAISTQQKKTRGVIKKLVADTPLRQPTLTPTLILNPIFFCTNNAPFSTGNEHTANDVSCSMTSVTSYVLNADSGLYVRVVNGLGWPMGWVGLGWIGSTIAKVLKFWQDYVNAFKAWLDKIWLHQTVKFVSCIGFGRVGSKFFHF